jgi:hypothetical protein
VGLALNKNWRRIRAKIKSMKLLHLVHTHLNGVILLNLDPRSRQDRLCCGFEVSPDVSVADRTYSLEIPYHACFLRSF